MTGRPASTSPTDPPRLRTLARTRTPRRTGITLAAAAGALILCAVLTSCADDRPAAPGPGQTPTSSAATNAPRDARRHEPADGTKSAAGATPAHRAHRAGPGSSGTLLPNLVGMGLQSAQEAARGAGFENLTSHDALGRGRHQILDRSWRVCGQAPAPGRWAKDSPIDLGAVRLEERCPAGDQGRRPIRVSTTMADFRGRSLAVARAALPPDTGIEEVDGTGAGRAALLESNWRICAQSPAAGTRLHGQPVRFTMVKFTEHCR
ncbi:hypothetical protein SAMN05421678_101134 [Actinopolymorpha cephalotaxi]|uniref:PASTA domain-containing protein n=1 Tax=Actinopolymorpha cephalotaxi TaxID=504797 RepID=A0A1I2K8P4_9ACTN|nr:PASTA domain-containing protein [Actinopolymorpha cephalotaxi]NYH84366.1 hypothetical protein [Actinopolymorpha cephalotaxi]SFF63492.1 hypothetical protein SAMN05421678_101134 [Actinopolymorpha cephalotaxi]